MNHNKLEKLKEDIKNIELIMKEINSINTLKKNLAIYGELDIDFSTVVSVDEVKIKVDQHVAEEKLGELLDRQLKSLINQRDLLAIDLDID